MFGQRQAPQDGFQVTLRGGRLVLGCLGGDGRSGCWPLVHQQDVQLLVGGVERIEAGACEVAKAVRGMWHRGERKKELRIDALHRGDS